MKQPKGGSLPKGAKPQQMSGKPPKGAKPIARITVYSVPKKAQGPKGR